MSRLVSPAGFSSHISQNLTAAKGVHFLDLSSSLQPNYPGYKICVRLLSSIFPSIADICSPSSPGVCSNGLGGNKSSHGLKASQAGRRNPHNANLSDSSNPVMCGLAHGGFNELERKCYGKIQGRAGQGRTGHPSHPA